MAADATAIPDDLEQLRRRSEEFRNTQSTRSRLPEPLWTAELTKRYGVHPTARALRVDYTALKRRLGGQSWSKGKRKLAAPPSFAEFVARGAKAATNYMIELESAQGGKLRMELKAVARTELENLMGAFVSQ